MSDWIEVKASLPEEPLDWSIWVEVFRQHGVEGTVQVDSPPSLSGYIPANDSRRSDLNSALAAAGAEVAETVIPEEDWAESWKQFFVPRRVGERLVVRPTWEEAEVGASDIEIVLDPGQAFGTGDHPTTRGCLTLLEKEGVQGRRVADVGCGSGILAVAAVKLGATGVVAVDSDALSVEAAQANAERNGVVFTCYQGRGFEPIADQGPFDVVMSNIISSVLIQLTPEASQRITTGGAWIVSGIIQAHWPELLEAAEASGFTLEDKIEEDEWVSALLRR